MNGILYAYEGGEKWKKWVMIDIVIIGTSTWAFYWTYKNRRICANTSSLRARRQHLVLCFKLMCANLPTQLYFIGEVVSCLMRQQMKYKKIVPETSFELLDNSCNGVLYGITPRHLQCLVYVQYINYGLHHEMQHDVGNVIRLKLILFQMYRVANSAALVMLAIFAYSMRREDSFKEKFHERPTFFWFIIAGMFLVSVELGLTTFKVIFGCISEPRRSLLPSDRGTSDLDERLGDLDKSMWDGGSKGTPIDLTATQRMKTRKELLSKDKSVAVFEISPGFL
ncbi:hypothetical protein TrLO_g822 [Triparma laevis f. longispina]|uniref:Uncharacterized protein n=1 Tax=Triparma laevis f. longispina TaxID=1714387 RepID=A0A9W7APK3_9STRA|nr:hypothetical protein TrLO_g822 [Triparma laevis f. longispina]